MKSDVEASGSSDKVASKSRIQILKVEATIREISMRVVLCILYLYIDDKSCSLGSSS